MNHKEFKSIWEWCYECKDNYESCDGCLRVTLYRLQTDVVKPAWFKRELTEIDKSRIKYKERTQMSPLMTKESKNG